MPPPADDAAAGDAERASWALSRAQSRPVEARAVASAVLASPDTHAVAVALRALGLCCMELGELDDADRRLAASAERAEEIGDFGLAAQSHLSRSIVLSRLGRLEDGFAAAAQARTDLPAELEGRLHLQLGLLHHRGGHEQSARQEYAAAIAGLERVGDLDMASRVRNNRALLVAATGDLVAAEADLHQVAAFYRSTEDDLAAAKAVHNLALVQASRGALHDALRSLADAEATFVRLGADRSVVLADHCRVLIGAGMADEAWSVGQAAITALRASGSQLDLVELELALGFLAIAEDRAGWAERHLLEAEALAVQQDRSDLAAVGRRARRLAVALAGAGVGDGGADQQPAPDGALREAEAAATLHVALRLLDRGDDLGARAVLPVPARRRAAPEMDRARNATAAAATALLDGDERHARAGLRAGFAHLHRHLAGLGSTDLRAATLRQASQLEVVGLRVAAASGTILDHYQWSERHRALAGKIRAPQQVTPEVDALMAELRGLRYQANEAAASAAGELRRRQAGIERRIRRLMWVDGRASMAAGSEPAPLDEVEARLHGRTAVSWTASGGELRALVVGAGITRLVGLGSAELIGQRAAAVRAAVETATQFMAAEEEDSLGDALAKGTALDRVLLEPLGLGDAPVVLVPTGDLVGVPWSVLPTLRGRAVTVSTSLSTWRPPTGHRPARVLLVAGPRLEHAAAEVRSIGSLYEDPVVLAGRDATIEAVLHHLGDCDVAHIVAHGEVRTDRPTFSSLTLADGRLFVEDIERAPRLPGMVVWSACDLGRAGIATGGQLFGLAAALSGRGCETLVGATGRVRDAEAGTAMTGLHRRLLAGDEPAAALAAVQVQALRERAATICTFTAFAVPH